MSNVKEINEIEISENERFKWYALMCIPNHENSVKKTIERELNMNGLSEWVDIVHVPTMKEVVVKDGKRRTKEKVMIPGYILIHMDVNNGELIPCIRKAKGVSSWLNPTDGKAKQRPEEMRERDVKRFLNVSKLNNESIDIDFSVGEDIKLIDGAFSGMLGCIQHINGNKVNVLVSIFGRETSILADMSEIDKK